MQILVFVPGGRQTGLSEEQAKETSTRAPKRSCACSLMTKARENALSKCRPGARAFLQIFDKVNLAGQIITRQRQRAVRRVALGQNDLRAGIRLGK